MDPEWKSTVGVRPRASTASRDPGDGSGCPATALPDDLPEEVLEFDLPENERTCPQTGAERRFIRWEQTEKIHFVPGHFKRPVIRRAGRAVPFSAQEAEAVPVETPVVTAALPAEFRVIPGAIATSGFLAYLMVATYCVHLPFYRLQQIFHRRHKVVIDRGAMCHWMGRCAALLSRHYEALRKELVSGRYLQNDEWSGAT